MTLGKPQPRRTSVSPTTKRDVSPLPSWTLPRTQEPASTLTPHIPTPLPVPFPPSAPEPSRERLQKLCGLMIHRWLQICTLVTKVEVGAPNGAAQGAEQREQPSAGDG